MARVVTSSIDVALEALPELPLVGKEREHYLSLEELHDFCVGKLPTTSRMVTGVREMVRDWSQMLGTSSSMSSICEKYLVGTERGDQLAARKLYLLVSPIFFYVHSLYQASRALWRNAVIACGIFCERIVRNLILSLAAQLHEGTYDVFRDKPFDQKNGRVKHELECSGFVGADDLHSLLKRIYSARSNSGPHDVPPPEPIQARINVTLCLPVYLDYVRALEHLGERVSIDSKEVVSFMTQATQVEVVLSFGAESDQSPAWFIVKDKVYRFGFFAEDRSLRDIAEKLLELRYSFSDSVLANALRDLSTGKDAVLNRSKRNRVFFYRERLPPSEYFKSTI